VHIGDSLFQNAKVRRVAIPEGIDTIRRLMFYGCKELTQVVVRAGAKLTVLPAAFEGTNPGVVLAVNPGTAVTGLPPQKAGEPPGVVVDDSKRTTDIRVGPLLLEPATTAATPQAAAVPEAEFGNPRVIAKGAFGEVTEVQRLTTGRLCARKMLFSQGGQTPNEFLQTVQREVLVLLKLRGHPSIVGLVGFTPPLGGAKVAPIFMQLATGGSLADLVRKPDSTPTTRAKWAVGVALGMRFCHSKQIIHRDLKPGNILLDERGEVKIGDFGSSKNEQTMTSQSRTVGTLHYVAPELTEVGGDYDETVDVYSYGILLWEIVKGIAPFAEFPITHQAQESAFLRAVRERNARPKLDATIKDWVRELLQKLWDSTPSARPTFAQVLDVLAAKGYALLDGVDKAAVQDYRTRVETVEATLKK
jgi:hypothetical protein